MIERADVDGIAEFTLDHGPVNAMDIELCQAIVARCDELSRHPARAVVLTGMGRSFSAGVDLRRIVDGGRDYVAQFVPALSAALRAVFEIAVPVVAAVNGHAIAGGCVLAAAADATIVVEGGARIGLPETRVGVPFPRAALEIVRHAVGELSSRRLIMGGQTYPADQAGAFGLVDEVVPAERLLGRAREVAEALAGDIPHDTFAVTKAQLRRETIARMDTYGDEDMAVTEVWARRVEDGWIGRYLESVTRR